MPTALILRHIAFEDLGSLATALQRAAFTLTTLDMGVDGLDTLDPTAADLVVVLGGPIGVCDLDAYPWLKPEIEWLAHRLHADRPTLGICLGAQLMAAALGAQVMPGPIKEIGWSPLHLTPRGRHSVVAAIGGALTSMLHWHGDTFDLPEGAVCLAGSDLYTQQIFAWGDHALAFQCHPELDPARFERWLIGHAAELSQAGIDIPTLRALTAALGPSLVRQAATMWAAWLRSQGFETSEPQGSP